MKAWNERVKALEPIAKAFRAENETAIKGLVAEALSKGLLTEEEAKELLDPDTGWMMADGILEDATTAKVAETLNEVEKDFYDDGVIVIETPPMALIEAAPVPALGVWAEWGGNE